MKIKNIHAIEILDSRGIPTISTEVELWSGDKAKGEVPSGASTGENEVLELRDGDMQRYNGKGVHKAVEIVNTIIKDAVVDKEFESQKALDEFLIQLDGTKNKSKLGGNSILSVSMAFCRAVSQRIGLELYEYIGMIYWDKEYSEDKFKLPMPQILLMEGGRHGNWSTDIQEYMIIPKENIFPNFKETLRAGSEIFHSIHNILDEKGYSVGVGYEGAYAPKEIQSNKEALDILVMGIERAGYTPGNQFGIALDIASSEFFNKESKKYELKRENREYVITTKRLKSIVRNIRNITIKAKTKRSAKIMLREKCPICDEFIFDTFATNLAGKKIRLGYKCKKCGFKTTSRAIMPMKYTFIWKSK